MSHFNPRWIVGKTIARVEMNPFDDGRGHVTHNPWIFFTDGSSIGFHVRETEDAVKYGVDIAYTKP